MVVGGSLERACRLKAMTCYVSGLEPIADPTCCHERRRPFGRDRRAGRDPRPARRSLEHGDRGARAARQGPDLPPRSAARRGRLPALDRRSECHRQGLRRPSPAGDRLRYRHLARGPHRGALRRGHARSVADEPGDRGQRRGPGLPGPGGRHPQPAEYAFARYRAVLPDRSRGGRQHRRHGRDPRLGHQRGPLRHHARQRARPHGGARGRRRDPDRRPRQEVRRGL